MAWFALFGAVVFFIGALYCRLNHVDFWAGVFAVVSVLLMSATIKIATSVEEIPDTTTYMPAEIVAENENYTFFSTNDGHIFCVDKNENWPNDVPYLLDMETHGTDDVTDDEVLVVWRTE